MKIRLPSRHHRRASELAYSLVEVTVGLGLFGLVAASLFSGMTMTTAQTRVAQEDLRATQILLERTEGIRLFDWNQLTNTDLCPTTFTASSYPTPNGSAGSNGFTYYGTMLITNSSLNCTYSNQVRAITVSVAWTNFGLGHQRTMTTYQAQYGMQNYIFNN